MQPDWYFPPNHGGEESGLNDAGIEFFRTSGSLARETVQNSGDASDNSGLPVRVVFARSFVSATEFPGAPGFRKIMQACRDYSLAACKTAEERAQNGEAFFARALGLLDGPRIPFLYVSDFNTTGLEGSDSDSMSPWYRLIRKQGSASLHGAGGGTFGIGQRAPFASSDLRTVFYATRTRSGDASLIGKSILSTFQQADGSRCRNVGYFGWKRTNDLVEPIRGATSVQALRAREHVGTDLVVAGFLNDDWVRQMGRAVVRNFFAAIHEGRLEVELKEEGQASNVITRDTLEGYIEALLALERDRAPELTKAEAREIETELTATQHYLSALTRPHGGEPARTTLPKLGDVRLYVTLAESAPSRVAYMRRPRILVYDRAHRASLQGYAAVMICDSVDGSALLGRLEDPSHTKWDRERVKGGGAMLASIYAFVRDSLSAIASTAATEAQDIPDLGRFLPEDETPPGAGPRGTSPTEDHTNEETLRKQQQRAVIRKPARPVPPIAALPDDSRDGVGAVETGLSGAGHVGEGDGGLGGGDEPGAGSGPLGGELPGGRSLADSDIGFRSFYDARSSSLQLVVWSRADGVADLSLSEVGETGTYPLELILAVDLDTGAAVSVEGSVLRRIRLARGERRHFELRARDEAKTALSLGIRNGG